MYDKKPPSGGIFHVAGFTAGTLHVLDIWESQDAFEKFNNDRLTPAVQKAGITTPPKVQFYQAYNIYMLRILEAIRKVGSTAMPGRPKEGSRNSGETTYPQLIAIHRRETGRTLA